MAFGIEPALGTIFSSIRTRRRHHAHNAEAARVLRCIEQVRGKVPRRDIQLCNQYAIEVFGSSVFAPWLLVYSLISGGFKEGWIPDNYYGLIVVPALSGGYGKVSSLKPLNLQVFRDPAFPDLLSHVNGLFLGPDYAVVSPETVASRLFANTDRVIFKQDNSGRGRGIHFFERQDFDPRSLARLGNGLFQSVIRQHALFAAFAKASVATIRITTFLQDNGDVTVRACYLRLGTEADTHVRSQSHIRVAIDQQSGAFDQVGYTTDWLEIENHPTSMTCFAGNVIPAFKECLQTVTRLHRKAPYARCIGWDLTVDDKEQVCVMEWNANHNDIKFSEATQGPCFADLGWEKLRHVL